MAVHNMRRGCPPPAPLPPAFDPPPPFLPFYCVIEHGRDALGMRLSSLSHLGLSLTLMMICFALFFFVLSVGPVLVLASSQSCLLASE